MEIKLTSANFEEEVIKAPELVLIDFWAEWCGPCKMIGPVMEELANEFTGKGIKIAKCNVDENADLAQKYQIMSIPAFKIFKGGTLIDEWVGAMPKEAIKQRLEKLL
ncbi:MAG: thioredoxin [Candidatus Buchananbacteria bacterium RBG_13_39_9]|uniref:Thioredoxin n=1 Tax=Candidatus Buchananbacteria bacterium RBG_13_39_9 TaxID=1797531 RepID=A0A1G1XRB4_9BACT|nr:MAG: thioredoxin [Candidatus Buchananbacteria bacterium RBG_13_39_9]